MNANDATLRDAGVDDPDALAIITRSELLSLIGDFESLVAAGLLHGTRQEAAHFFSGWLVSGDRHDRPLPDPLQLIVLPGFGKNDR
jgi:hypothetical protein